MEHAVKPSKAAQASTPAPLPAVLEADVEPETGHPDVSITNQLRYYWGKGTWMLLTFHSLFGLYESFRFLFIEYPKLDTLLIRHQATWWEVFKMSYLGGIIVITTLINIAAAVKMRNMRNQEALTFDLILSAIIVIGTFGVYWYLRSVSLLF